MEMQYISLLTLFMYCQEFNGIVYIIGISCVYPMNRVFKKELLVTTDAKSDCVQKGLKTQLQHLKLSLDKANVLWINNHSAPSAYNVTNYFQGPKRGSLSEHRD